MSQVIRVYDPEDAPQVVEVFNAVNPQYPMILEDYLYSESTREERINWGRYVCEEDGRLLGYGGFTNMTWMFHPRKFYFYLNVHPDAQKRGIGGELFRKIEEGMAEYDPLSIRSEIKEDRPASIRFVEKRGFVAGMREQESALDLANLEPEKFTDQLAKVEEEGIKIVSYDDLAEDPDRHRKIWDFDRVVGADMPSPEPITQPDYENFCLRMFEHKKFFPRGNLIALDDDAYIGLTNLWHRNVEGSLDTGFTGVRREYRGLGVATALKVKVLSQVKEMGYREVLTSNDSTNADMLGINRRLGFEQRPAWIDYEKILPAGGVEDGTSATPGGGS